MKRVAIISSILSTVLAPAIALAGGINQADNLLQDVGSRAGAEELTVQSAIGSALSIALSLVGTIFLILMIYAGFLWLTSQGDQGQVDKARKMIVAAVIGLVIVVSSYAITVFIGSQFS